MLETALFTKNVDMKYEHALQTQRVSSYGINIM